MIFMYIEEAFNSKYTGILENQDFSGLNNLKSLAIAPLVFDNRHWYI